MCGISGMFKARTSNREVLQRMLDAIVHRGPDAQGVYEDGEYLAGMRRLSINDLEGGDQPLFNETGTVAMLYNGEMYNSPQLREKLKADGATFVTRSDGEVLCHLYDRYGESAFEQLDGMYACALWDSKKKRLILARDIPGEKPLYYALLSGGGVVFSSELKGLVRHPEVSRELNMQALWDFPSFLWIPDPETVLTHVKSVKRGTMLIFDGGSVTERRIENKFGPSVDIASLSDEEAIALTRSTVEAAVKSRLLSDVPVGSFLSGGLDSSIICAIASRELPSLATFTIGFEDCDDPYHGKADESVQAEYYAGILGTKHTTIRVFADDFKNSLREFCRYGDQPCAVSSGLGVYHISKHARMHDIKVLLTGDGADEAFGGYSWYFHLQDVLSATPVAPQEADFSFQNLGVPLEERLQGLSSFSPEKRAWAWHYYASEGEKERLFSRDAFAGSLSSLRFFDGYFTQTDTPEKYIRHDQGFYFPYEMLRKADRMTMANSVEGRVPFAAPAVQKLAEGLSINQMVRGNDLKWVLRRAFADLLPQDVVGRAKHGFNVPIDNWLNGDWVNMIDESFSANSMLAKNRLISENARSEAVAMLNSKTRLSGHSVFCYIMLNMWLEEFSTWN